MKIDDFVAARQAQWTEMETYLARARRGQVRGLSTAEMERFSVLYRHAASDLAIARRDFPDEAIAAYLNAVCARAHPLLTRGDPLRFGDVLTYFGRTVPRLFRRAWPYFLLSLMLLIAGMVAGWLAVELRPDLRSALVPQSAFDLLARGEIKDIPDPVAGSWTIIFNNIIVSTICLAGGVLIGIPTALIIAQNGWMLGTLAAAVHDGGYDLAFWQDIVPHGIVELSIIVIAGGSGLMLAAAVLRPGRESRGSRLPRMSLDAVKLTIGVSACLVICGILEGFVSPSTLPAAAKFAVGGTYAVLFYGWLTIGGRSQRRPASLTVG